MERDFLGINGGKEDNSRGSCHDSGGSSMLQWPFSACASLQQFMTFKAAHEERQNKAVFDHLSGGFQSTDANQKSPTVVALQKCLSLDRQGSHPFTLQSYKPQNSNTLVTTKQSNATFPVYSDHSIPVATNGHFFKVHGSPSMPNMPISSLANCNPSLSSMLGTFTTGNASKPSPTAQLTIFYAGSVNIYDDVPLEKAQALMFIAGCGSNSKPSSLNLQAQTPPLAACKSTFIDCVSTDPTPVETANQLISSHTAISSPITVTSHATSQSLSASSKPDDKAVSKAICQKEASNTTATLGSVSTMSLMTRAVPQARKASLARFLEKRKERVTNAVPYSCANKKSTEDVNRMDAANISRKVSSPDAGVSSNTEQCWFTGQSNDDIYGREYPSTKLEM